MPPFLLATWVVNSELQLESSLLWTHREAGPLPLLGTWVGF